MHQAGQPVRLVHIVLALPSKNARVTTLACRPASQRRFLGLARKPKRGTIGTTLEGAKAMNELRDLLRRVRQWEKTKTAISVDPKADIFERMKAIAAARAFDDCAEAIAEILEAQCSHA